MTATFSDASPSTAESNEDKAREILRNNEWPMTVADVNLYLGRPDGSVGNTRKLLDGMDALTRKMSGTGRTGRQPVLYALDETVLEQRHPDEAHADQQNGTEMARPAKKTTTKRTAKKTTQRAPSKRVAAKKTTTRRKTSAATTSPHTATTAPAGQLGNGQTFSQVPYSIAGHEGAMMLADEQGRLFVAKPLAMGTQEDSLIEG